MKLHALVSVSDKSHLADFGRALNDLDFEIHSTGGTSRALREAGIPVSDVSELTGTPEVMDGRVKTLHPKVFAGVLANLDVATHQQVLADWNTPPISLVAVNLYPFAETAARPGVGADEVIEQIDIGGPSLIRAAAKNHRHVTVVVDPSDYARVVDSLRAGGDQSLLRRELAVKAFRHTAAYDAAIAAELPAHLGLPQSLLLSGLSPWLGASETVLRYGENPHQRAVMARGARAQGLGAFAQLQGKELSYNNLMDADGAWRLVYDLPGPGVAIIKHASPCGVGVADDVASAYQAAFACDPVSAFGGVIAASLPINATAATAITKQFAEVVIAPAVDEEARAILAAKKNLRVLEAPPATTGTPRLRVIDGGLLVQSPDDGWDEEWRVVTRRQPSREETAGMRLAWAVAKHVPSNAIVVANPTATVGIGGGQPSRVDACRIAVEKARTAGLKLVGSGAGSDAFFPFPDGLEVLASAGVTAVAQPGGSMRDNDVIAAADALDVAMVFTGRRHFRH